PDIADTGAADEAGFAVDDEELAVRAVVDALEGVPAERLIPHDLSACGTEVIEEPVGGEEGAEGVEDEFHFDAGAGSFCAGVDESGRDFALPEDIRFEVDAALRAANCFEFGSIEILALREHFHPAASMDLGIAERTKHAKIIGRVDLVRRSD